MNTRSSSWTGRAPRSMEAAFGPYTSSRIEEPSRPVPLHEKALYVVSVIGALVVFVRIFLESVKP